MKNIGILTFANSYNYGAVLQSIALYNVLSINNNVRFINYNNSYENMDHKLLYFKKNQSIKYNIKNNINNILLQQHYHLTKSFKSFINQYEFTKKYTNQLII